MLLRDGYLVPMQAVSVPLKFQRQGVDHLTENGVMEPSRLYETPYTDVSPSGVDGVFPDSAAVDEVVSILDDVKRKAAA